MQHRGEQYGTGTRIDAVCLWQVSLEARFLKVCLWKRAVHDGEMGEEEEKLATYLIEEDLDDGIDTHVGRSADAGASRLRLLQSATYLSSTVHTCLRFDTRLPM